MSRYRVQHPHVDGDHAVIDEVRASLVQNCLPREVAVRITDALNALDEGVNVNAVLTHCTRSELHAVCRYVGMLARGGGA